jgi:hypothetical protein
LIEASQRFIRPFSSNSQSSLPCPYHPFATRLRVVTLDEEPEVELVLA